MLKDEGGPAFPLRFGESGEYYDGMTIRDYFAAAALPALVERAEGHWVPTTIAWCAYDLADAMIAARRQDHQK